MKRIAEFLLAFIFLVNISGETSFFSLPSLLTRMDGDDGPP